MTDLATAFQETLIDVLKPLEEVSGNSLTLIDWLADLGHTPAVASDPNLLQIVQRAQSIVAKLRAFDADTLETMDGLASLLATGREAATILQDLRTFAADPARSQFAMSLGDDVMSSLLASALRRNHATAFRVASLLTLVNPKEVAAMDAAIFDANGTTLRYARALDQFAFGGITGLLADPGAALKAVYLPNGLAAGADAWAAADRLFPHLSFLADALDLGWRTESRPNGPLRANGTGPLLDAEPVPDPNDPETVQAIDDSGGPALEPLPPVSDTDFATIDPVARINLTTGLALEILVASQKHPGGFAGLLLQLIGSFNRVETRGPWRLTFSSTGALPALAIGPTSFAVAPTTGASPSGSAKFLIERIAAPGTTGPAFLLGSAKGTRLEIGSLGLSGDVSFDAQSWALSLGVNASSGALVITGGDGDGFLADILPADGLRAAFDLGLTWANDSGLTFRGSAGLDTTLPVNLAIGPVTLSAIHLGLLAQADSGSVVTDVSVNVNAAIGPIRAAVERVGLTATLSFPAAGGNLGPADLAFGFKSPSAVGLSVDAHGILTGGGFLEFDLAQGMYAGVMQLAFQDSITLTAFGIITTKLPDGRPGYSLLIFITADGFRPVPLGFGFVLQSIGGMVGVHRTFDEQVLRAGLKTDTLGTLLFPRDPVRNASALIQALGTAFPAQRGSYLVGLLARITWFTPTLVTIDLALILELGVRTRLLVLARVSALLPSRDNDLVRLTLDAIGVVDFDASTLAIDAVLVDSRLVHQFPITGSAALRARWAGQEDFVLAVGGLNPHFAAPAGFPTLERVTIALCSGTNPRLVCDAYLAITANTVQFGARASLYAEAVGFSITGDVGFDALITLVPPHFLVDFHASVQLKRGSHNLFKLTVDGTLEGPLPLRIAAKVKFEILWFSYSVHFDFTLTAGDVARVVVPAVSLVTELAKALADPANWSTQLPAGLAHGVALAPLAAGSVGTTVLDPLGQLVVKQQVAPLNTARAVTTFGGVPVAGDTRFRVAATLNGLGTATPVTGPFAPARYFAMSDDAKLAAPSFEAMDAGLALGDPTATYDASGIVAAPVSYLPITLNPLPPGTTTTTPTAPAAPTTLATPARYVLPVEAFTTQRPTGAAARVPARRVGRARFRNTTAGPAATVAPPRWRIVQVSDGAVAPLDPAITTWSDYRDALDTLNRGGARWQMVPAHELTA